MNDTELLSVLSELGITEDQLALLTNQLKSADELRKYQPATTIQTSGGVVPAYGSMLLGMVERGRAKKEYDTANKGIQEALQRQRAGREKFGQALLAPPQAPTAPPAPAAGPMGPPAPTGAMGPPAPMGGPPPPAMGPPQGLPAPTAPMARPSMPRPSGGNKQPLSPEAAAIIQRLKNYGTANPQNAY